jgi:4-diphosphocytidyl-2-C-methyl-D-erythritol kinase
MERSMENIRLKARAKINLGLDVIGRRENGYHDVRMVMQTIGIYDRVIISKIPEDEIRIKSNLYFLPVNENNLMYKAAKALKEKCAYSGGVEIDLNKFIPVSAGLAGGSTDAASTLFGINRLFDLGLSTEELMELGLTVGADVPYCIMRGTALAEGIGEQLTRISPLPRTWILIAKPPINVSTKLVYESLDMNGVDKHPDIDGLIQAIDKGDMSGVCACMGNVLENVTVPMYPVIDSIKRDMMEHGAVNAMMSGSGPTVFGIFTDEKTTLECQAFLKDKGEARQVYITESFN